MTTRARSPFPPDRVPNPGSADIVEKAQRLLNALPVPPGVHHDVLQPVPVLARLRWERDPEETVRTVAVEWTTSRVRVRLADARRHTGAAWLPATDVRRAPVAAR
ncbi:hypothetical protein [Cellulomonas marina]|uniref:Uncharacterized protein n=1 Tax=Cellulomonas marina TaxID=988821 RepID=A0A1I0Z276_9CELL|nr:hypothetical protein [Cellulomonas marina]GIG28178.1 hypothetical protein Cma02nite_07780 [Cellulomonas marina]SFB19472.1 hypothetical protein SAMN05421867_109118 [Cellulomonas marina]